MNGVQPRRSSRGPDDKSLPRLAWAAGSFTLLAVVVIALAVFGVVTMQLALLMLVGLVGLYFGLGVLVLVYRFVSRLD
jgi:uncharacterized membrane protein